MNEEARLYLEEIEQIPLLSAQEFHTLLLRSAAGDENAQMELVNANLRLVVDCARNYVGQGAPFSDLIQEGNIGLLKAVKKFSTKGAATFTEYAQECIEAAIVHGLRELKTEETLLLDTPIEKSAYNDEEDYVEGMTLADLLADEETPKALDRLNRSQLIEFLREAMKVLTMREKKILVLRFGLDNRRACTTEEVARILKISPETLRAIEANALKKLSRSERLKEFN
ncbi:MAG: sigma-70 family RNA polymerase sigma factor [Selenomonadaceae bacterium]|nr:sigma-70 family RNA polymerase sigma factor [Selenomonadaceae bacterium]